MTGRIKDGWDDWEEDDDEAEGILTPPPRDPAAAVGRNRVVAPPPLVAPSNEGWNEDEDDLDELLDDDDDDDDDVLNSTDAVRTAAVHPQHESVLPTASLSANRHGSVSPLQDGWDDDDDIDTTNDENNTNVDVDNQHLPDPNPLSRRSPSMKRPTKQQPHQLDRSLETHLLDYIDMLESLKPSLQALLDAEYNTPEKAAELADYYQQRPGLVQFTLDKELSRMEYHTPSSSINNNNAAAEWFHTSQSLTARCANQSLLADLLQVVTGPDRLVRPQFFATAVAEHCRFVVNDTSCQVHAILTVSLPSSEKPWTVARLETQIVFVPSEPYIEFVIQSIQRLVSPNDPSFPHHLAHVVEFLQEFHEPLLPPLSPDTNNNNNNFRDVFLQQSQSLFQNSAVVGMQSAWNDLQAVANVKHKLQLMPSFLPHDLVQQAAEAAAEVPTYSPQQLQQQHRQQRPTSILGGLVRSGWSQLAKTVTLPDERPDLYDEWQPTAAAPSRHSQPPHIPPRLYNQRADPAPFQPVEKPQEDKPSRKHKAAHHESPILYRTVEEVSVLDEWVAPSPTHNIKWNEPEAQRHLDWSNAVTMPEDGWDDDDDDALENLEVLGDDNSPLPAAESVWEVPLTKVLMDEVKAFMYDPTSGPMPTRKRWTNPRPGPRDIRLRAANNRG